MLFKFYSALEEMLLILEEQQEDIISSVCMTLSFILPVVSCTTKLLQRDNQKEDLRS